MLNKRMVLSLVLALVFVFVTACSGNGGSSNKGSADGNNGGSGSNSSSQQKGSDEKAELRIMWWGSDTRHEATLKVIRLFEEKYPHITFSEEYLGSDGYWDKLNILVAGGNAPDIIQLGNNYPDYYAKDALLDLTPYMGNEFDISNIDSSIVSSGMIDDKLYGVNLGSNAFGIIYNKELIAQAGLEEPQQDWTWDEFEAYMRDLKEALPGVFPMADQSNSQHLLNHFIRQKNKAIYKDGAIAHTKEDLVEWFELWDRYRQEGLIPDAQTAATYTETGPDTSLIIEGKSVMKAAFSNQFKAYQDLMQAELEITLPPFGGEVSGIWLQPSQFMSVNKKTKHPKEAAMFLSFMVNDPEATLILATDRGIPGSSAVRDALKEGASVEDTKVFNFVDLAVEHSRDMDRELPNGGEWVSVLANAAQKVAFKSGTIEEAAAEVLQAAEEAIKK